MYEVDASVSRVAVVLKYTCRVWSGFGKAACAIGGVMRGVGLLEDALTIAWLLIIVHRP